MTKPGSVAAVALGGPMFYIGPSGGRAAAPPRVRWYGESLEWCWMVEQGLRSAHGRHVRTCLYEACLFGGAPRVLAYTHAGLEVPGRRDPVPVRIEFHERPSYDTYDLAPRDYPRVFADPDLPSPHRMPDDSLCLYMPKDPEDRRWHSALGLDALFNLTPQPPLQGDAVA